MNIGVIVPSVYNMFFAEVLDGIEDYLRRYSYFLMLSCAKSDGEQELNSIRAFVEEKVCGIIVVSPNTQGFNPERYLEAVKDTPLVFVNAHCKIPGASYVSNDEELGALEAIRFLGELGHEKILFVRGENADSYQVKEDAFRSVMSDKFNVENYIVNIGEGNSLNTADLTTYKLSEILLSTDATAVFCCNDLMAVGAINACHQIGLEVPEDISVIGYDNTSIANYFTPKITSVDQNMFQLGRNAAQVLIEKIKTGKSKRITLYNTIIERESTGVVRR